MKDTIKEILKSYLAGVYCNSCESEETEEYCEDCHRKAMNWGISDAHADKIASEIEMAVTEAK